MRVIRASVTLRSEYTCRACGSKKLGDVSTHDLGATTSYELQAEVARIKPTPYHMPVGWGSFFGGKFQCAHCNEA
jgi:hypothetical protein